MICSGFAVEPVIDPLFEANALAGVEDDLASRHDRAGEPVHLDLDRLDPRFIGLGTIEVVDRVE